MCGPNIRGMAARMNNVETLMLEQSAHMMIIDQPIEMNTALENWLVKMGLKDK